MKEMSMLEEMGARGTGMENAGMEEMDRNGIGTDGMGMEEDGREGMDVSGNGLFGAGSEVGSMKETDMAGADRTDADVPGADMADAPETDGVNIAGADVPGMDGVSIAGTDVPGMDGTEKRIFGADETDENVPGEDAAAEDVPETGAAEAKGPGVKPVETIGKIVLDYRHYPGQDFYCDGEVEDELLEIVKKYSDVEYQRIIEERASWPILYHLSPLRENIVDWIPMDKEAKVLEIGSGCGAITGKLSEKAGSVTCIELSRKRSLINAYRHQDCDNVTIHVGNFKDIEPDLPDDFDYICFIGVFEYGQSYINTRNPYVDWLKMMHGHLKEDGRIIIAIENKLGLKYFAGCMEDHLGTFFSGIEDYAQGGGVRTFSRNRLEQMFRESGLTEYSFYYPYPDYKFMTTLYSDGRLPKPGELYDNQRNFDRERLNLFDEKQAFDGIAKDELFSVFSNSYLAVIGEGFDIKYVKYSNDRAPEYAIRTEIIHRKGLWSVKKKPLSEYAVEHIGGMETAYHDLKERFAGSKLEVNRCRLNFDSWGANFEYVEGVTLEEILDSYLERDDIDGFQELFDEYVERISWKEDMPVADYDLIFANILILPETARNRKRDDGTEPEWPDVELVKSAVWMIIDYEWTFGKPMAAKEIAFRAIYCYVLENEKRDRLDLGMVMDKLGITEQEAESYRQQEMEFQKFVTGRHKSMGEMRDAIGHRVIDPLTWLDKRDDSSTTEWVQISEDSGGGCREEESYFVADAHEGENTLHFSLAVDGNVHLIRIDPAMDYCAVKIEELLFNGVKVEPDRKTVVTNGRRMQNGSYVFATEDPNINIKLEDLARKADNELEVKMEIVRIPAAIAQDMAAAVKRFF